MEKTLVCAETTEDRLKDLGFHAAAKLIERKKDMVRKAAVAYEHYRYVTQEQIAEYRRKLSSETRPTIYSSTWLSSYDVAELRIRDIGEYPGIPPQEVLNALAVAKERDCFDSFEVADIEWVRVIPDPILFGRINNCPDRFVIAEWGDDISVADIIGPNEG